MTAASEKGMQIPTEAFRRRHPHSPRQIVFDLPRPPRGFTETFASFWTDHPEFQLQREKVRDPDVLRFNHQRHFAADIPPLNGHRLACNDCHRAEPNGRYYQRINFVDDCQACHSLQFDRRNPELKLPHGDVQLVRTFLRSLPAQYADYARQKKGKRSGREIQKFVAQQINRLRRDYGSGPELEQAVFFTTDPYKPEREMGARTRANFAGCAYCHEVKMDGNGIPAVTKPILIDRWMPRANFNHAKHQVDPATHSLLDCNACHHRHGQPRYVRHSHAGEGKLRHLPQPTGKGGLGMYDLPHFSRSARRPGNIGERKCSHPGTVFFRQNFPLSERQGRLLHHRTATIRTQDGFVRGERLLHQLDWSLKFLCSLDVGP